MKILSSRSLSFALVLATGGLLATMNGCSATDAALAADALNGDAGAPETQSSIELTTSSDSVTSEGTLTLTASVQGGVPSVVTFWDGARQIGEATQAPFAQQLPLAFPDNGTHSYAAKAVVAGKEISSKVKSVLVNVKANGLFVDPILGSDDNDGLSLQSPLKTILKALQGLLAGQTLYLAPEIFDAATQGGPLSYVLPQIANVLTYPSTGGAGNGTAILQGAGDGFTFPKGGSIKDVKFDGLQKAITGLSGKLTASGLRFNNVGLPFTFGGDSDASIDESNVKDFLTNVPTNPNGYWLLLANDASKTSLTGPILNDIRVGLTGILARGLSTVNLKGLKATGVKSRILTLADRAQSTVKDSDITGSGLATGTGAGLAPIFMGITDTLENVGQSLTLDHTKILGSQGPALGLDILPKAGGTDTIKIIGSTLDGNGGAGLLATVPSTATQTAQVVLEAVQSSLSNNGGDGLHLDRLTSGSVVDSTFLANAGDGIEAGIAQAVTGLTVKDSTFQSNIGNALTFLGTPASMLDLGSVAAPGGNVFTGIPTGSVGLDLGAVIQVNALGNTWVPNTPSTNSQGLFTTILGALGDGLNIKKPAGSTIKLF